MHHFSYCGSNQKWLHVEGSELNYWVNIELSPPRVWPFLKYYSYSAFLIRPNLITSIFLTKTLWKKSKLLQTSTLNWKDNVLEKNPWPKRIKQIECVNCFILLAQIVFEHRDVLFEGDPTILFPCHEYRKKKHEIILILHLHQFEVFVTLVNGGLLMSECIS